MTDSIPTEGCCRGTCKRKQPPMVMRSDLTGTWWVVLRYKDLGEGRFEALDKHMLADDTARQLEEMRSRLPVYADDVEVTDGKPEG